jgi:hypothetical protein
VEAALEVLLGGGVVVDWACTGTTNPRGAASASRLSIFFMMFS